MSVSPLTAYYQHVCQGFALTFELTALLQTRFSLFNTKTIIITHILSDKLAVCFDHVMNFNGFTQINNTDTLSLETEDSVPVDT